MDWFERLTGFREEGYEATRARLDVRDARLHSRVNGESYAIGELELPSLQELRERARSGPDLSGRIKVEMAVGDVGEMHELAENEGALFQVASQFNLLEMTSPNVTPEQGVTRYAYDHTQGPVCAMAAGAATIYRNYFVLVDGMPGQTEHRQIDCLTEMGEALSVATGLSVPELWTMTNGYALATEDGLDAISRHLDALPEEETDALRAKLRIGLHRDVEVTRVAGSTRPQVSQAFCSALPVAYSGIPATVWQPFAKLVLEAAYEATMWAGVLNAQRGASDVVLLTLLGGGAFGNHEGWIYRAMRRALHLVRDWPLDVKLVSYGAPPEDLVAMASEF